MSKLTLLVMELRRRRVFRMTAIYIVAGWVAVQVASEAFPAFNIPEGAIRYVWVAVLVGFPVAVLFSWRYDLTAAGIERTPAAHEDAGTDHSLTRFDFGVLTALGLIILVTIFDVGQRLVEVQTETARAPTTREIDPNSIAVLPLENLSPSEDDAYFAAGVHDALIANLSGISALMVTSRKSTMTVDSALSVPEIGRQLGVAKLLEGSVLMDGDRVRIIVQLIDAASDLHVWADTFERDLTDIISLQNEVARTIADVIEVRLTPREATTLADADPVRPETYRAYLKAMYQFRQDNPEADWRGVEMLEEVVREDPDSALAHAGLAFGYANIGHTPGPAPQDIYPRAKAAADAALQLDPELAEAHQVVGMYKVMYEWDFEGAEQALLKALELNPNMVWAHYDLAWLYEMYGPEWEDAALAAGDKTVELNPLSPFFIAGLAWQYADACQYEEGMRLAKEAIRLDPDHPLGWVSLGIIYAELGQFDEAIDAHRRVVDPPWSMFLGITYALAGREYKAREVAATWEKIPGAALAAAWIYMNLGDRDAALHWIGEAEKIRVPWYPWLLGNFTGIELIADDPRLQERAAALGLPDPRNMGCGA
jgi:TolB-like protein/tetratricopeptide (TPR) repeat protein